MSHENVIEDIEIEIKRIEKLTADYEPLLKRVKVQEPDIVELGSLAMLLHSFYNGLENIFTRIARKVDEELPRGEGWHRELLRQMATETERRKPVVLSESACQDLEEYLGFRHFSRHAYAFDLDWELMKDLVEGLPAVKQRVLGEIRSFISKLD
ncbi:MAG: hypothetical protein ACE5JC_05985 [Candidatus Zixiibacteriota bacterium]